jgi:hypothetical protein
MKAVHAFRYRCAPVFEDVIIDQASSLLDGDV